MSQKVEKYGATMKNVASMTTLLPPKLVENTFSRTSRLYRLVLHKQLCEPDGRKLKSIVSYQSYSIFTVANVYLCSANLWCKIALGA